MGVLDIVLVFEAVAVLQNAVLNGIFIYHLGVVAVYHLTEVTTRSLASLWTMLNEICHSMHSIVSMYRLCKVLS